MPPRTISVSGACQSTGATVLTSDSSPAAAATTASPAAHDRDGLSNGTVGALFMLRRSDQHRAQERKIRPHEDGFFCKHDQPAERLGRRKPGLRHQLLREPQAQAVLDACQL